MTDKPRKYNQRIDPLDPSFDKPRKSNRFSRMYKDYDFYRVPDADKRRGYRTVGVYKGVYYEADQDSNTRRRHRIILALILVFSLALFILASLIPFNYNRLWFVGIAEGLTFVSFSYVAIVLIMYFTSEIKMTEYTYNITSRSLKRSCLVTSILLAVCAVTTVIGTIVGTGDSIVFSLLGTVLFAADAISMYFMYRAEEAVIFKHWLSKDTIETSLNK